uniref:Histone chaperone domain-containing protein n=1 Tax=Anabas testudineus TaxID=64144 RepID=A0A3Q1HE39_ANATE
MVSEEETTSIRRFVCGQLRDAPDLSTLTLGILKKRYLAHVERESLSSEARNYMKEVVKEELLKMQRIFITLFALSCARFVHLVSKECCSFKTIKHFVVCLTTDSDDKEDSKTGSDESEEEDQINSGCEDTEQEVKKPKPKTNGNRKQQVTSDDSSDEETSESKKKRNESGDSQVEKMKKTTSSAENGEKKPSSTSEEKKTPQNDEENETDTDSKSKTSDKIKDNDSSDEKNPSTEKKNDEPDSDSSSLPSLEDEQNSVAENKQDNKKKKTVKKDEGAKDQKDDNKAIVRLKRYIALCGVRRNYKKLFSDCRSIRAKVAVLKKELEDLGVDGKPTIEKCKKVRMKRDEAQELADLDVSNIIATKGRPKRRGASAWQEQHDPPTSTYQRTLDSGSDEENDTQRGRRRATDWDNLQGIISDDADSD